MGGEARHADRHRSHAAPKGAMQWSTPARPGLTRGTPGPTRRDDHPCRQGGHANDAVAPGAATTGCVMRS